MRFLRSDSSMHAVLTERCSEKLQSTLMEQTLYLTVFEIRLFFH